MIEPAKQAHATASKWHECLYLALIRTRAELSRADDLRENVDGVFALKEVAKILDDSRKEVNKLLEELKRRTCLVWVATPDPDVIRTDYCTGSPEVKRNAIVPKPGTAEYASLCAYFGIDPDSPFRPHWRSMGALLSENEKQGRPLPPGVDPSKTLSVFEVATRRRPGVSIPEPGEPIDGVDGCEELRTFAERVADATTEALGRETILTDCERRVVATMAARIVALRTGEAGAPSQSGDAVDDQSGDVEDAPF